MGSLFAPPKPPRVSTPTVTPPASTSGTSSPKPTTSSGPPDPTGSTDKPPADGGGASVQDFLARRARGLAGTVLTSWQGVLQQNGFAPRRNSLLGE